MIDDVRDCMVVVVTVFQEKGMGNWCESLIVIDINRYW